MKKATDRTMPYHKEGRYLTVAIVTKDRIALSTVAYAPGQTANPENLLPMAYASAKQSAGVTHA